MKRININIVILAVCVLMTLSVYAQINSGLYTHRSDTPKDSAIDRRDEPKKDDGKTVKVIKVTPTAASKEKEKEQKGERKAASNNTVDTTATAAAPTAPDTTATVVQKVENDITSGTQITANCIDMNLIYTAIAVFGLAAIIGMYLIMLLMRDQKRPLFVIIIHGIFATAALTLFIVYCMYQPGPLAALTIFIVAALCGLVLVYNEVTGRPVPKWLGALHGVLALVGFVLLLVFAFAH